MRTTRAPYAAPLTLCTLGALAWAATAAPQGPTRTPPDKEACASAHEQAQVFRKHGQLIEARAKLELCAAPACPALARKDCGVWLVELNERVPTIVVSAKDAHGVAITAVRCTLDGAPLVEALDGTPIAVNPGAHTLTCAADGATVEQPLAVVEGEKARRVEIVFEPPRAPAPSASATAPSAPSSSASAPAPTSSAPIPPPPSRPVPLGVFAFGGLAVLGVASFAYFGISGLNDESNLRSTCHTSCNPSDVSAVTAKYHLADASLAVGVVAAGVAGWLYFSRPRSGAPQSGARFGVTAMPGGGGARVELPF